MDGGENFLVGCIGTILVTSVIIGFLLFIIKLLSLDFYSIIVLGFIFSFFHKLSSQVQPVHR
ncbi:hypothetical protein DIY01_09600 [Streptococcus iniae]|uniref:hypothetical protein n=1 Tax=Streptococcus iniae TaxID=1346 RepID=UPI000EF6953A|nr:hypothetical protein [Streptococcus iniae]RLU60058.1 hypothetical protein DIY01_09600 [Streptococcus iniae]